MAATTIKVVWREDGDATILGRVTARDATGAWTGIAGEGNWLKQADLSTITYAVFNLDGVTPTTATTSGSVTISTSIYDTPVTDQKIWDLDEIGYNFLFDVAATVFATANNRYKIECKFTNTAGKVGAGVWEGPAEGLMTS